MFIRIFIRPKKILISIFLLIFFSLLIMNTRNTTIPTQTSSMQFKVVVDAGHGSIDTGTSYGEVLEKEINLEIAKFLEEELKKVNIIPIMTRTEDKLYMDSRRQDIKRRPQIANEANADLFISIHANNYPSSQPKGSQIFYKKNSEDSKILAEYIKEELVEIREANNRSNQVGDFLVLNMLKCPGVLIEVGFLSNGEDRKKLKDPIYQESLARAIRKGIVTYFQEGFAETPKDISTIKSFEDTKKEELSINEVNNVLYYQIATENNIHHFKYKLSFPSSNFFNEDYTLLSFKEIMAITAIEELLEAPDGLISPLPKETKINSLVIKDNIAVLDLSIEASENFNGGASIEQLSVNAIKNTLFSIEGINGLQILIDGESGKSLGGHIFFDDIYMR
ncbi:N-acetylmuramoyl-L-alanine amidase [Natronospora cellulosivora (SeqCode)]